MGKIYDDITELLYDCCYGRGWVERGHPINFEASKVNITGFERELKKVLRNYKVTKRVVGSQPAHTKLPQSGSKGDK